MPAKFLYYVHAPDPEHPSPSSHLISSARVEQRAGGYERVTLWSRGAHVGELLLQLRDASAFVEMLGLVPSVVGPGIQEEGADEHEAS